MITRQVPTRVSPWLWLASVVAFIFGCLLIRSIIIYERGREQLNLLEAGISVGMTRTEVYEHVRSRGYTAYGVDPSLDDPAQIVIRTPWVFHYNATVPWPIETFSSHNWFVVISVPIGGIICDKRANLMINFTPDADRVSDVREVVPDQRCLLPVQWIR